MGILEYSSIAKKAYSFLYRPFNEIDIFVEDKANRAVYEKLFSRILEGKAKVVRIFQLGGRKEVIDACKADQSNSTRKKIYIVDGDLNLICGTRPLKLKYFYSLRVYCSENLLLCRKTLETIAHESDYNSTKVDVCSRLNFDAQIKSLEKSFLPLFVLYAICHRNHKKKIGVKTVSYNIHRFLDGGSPNVLKPLILGRMRVIITQLKLILGDEQYQKEKKIVVKHLRKYDLDLVCVLSGKDYILPFIHLLLTREFAYHSSFEQLKARIANDCDMKIDPFLYKALRRV
ncbi:Protein of unknown function (DUF4435) [Mariprofundus aestuarium]|uniref:DUF4435 domain-containing protein n=1 Tax=Mariprofundus aestuarium TaxID=1921086 RepID=A0A2K8KYA9_MARES|nr:DUF4435 domain-containing protein [Mariprofundus aestuarium]ATX79958.1 Protein of unknown function (DUF4435) [Mariprofundus aestuarium]